MGCVAGTVEPMSRTDWSLNIRLDPPSGESKGGRVVTLGVTSRPISKQRQD